MILDELMRGAARLARAALARVREVRSEYSHSFVTSNGEAVSRRCITF